FGLVISILLSFLLAKTMIGPIEQLTAGARRVAGGDFESKLEVASRDEIGVLPGTFHELARQLEDTLREVGNERNKLDTPFRYMTDGVVAFDHDGAVIHSNPAAEEMLGRAIPIGGETRYADLFGDVASLNQVLSVSGSLAAERQAHG